MMSILPILRESWTVWGARTGCWSLTGGAWKLDEERWRYLGEPHQGENVEEGFRTPGLVLGGRGDEIDVRFVPEREERGGLCLWPGGGR